MEAPAEHPNGKKLFVYQLVPPQRFQILLSENCEDKRSIRDVGSDARGPFETRCKCQWQKGKQIW